MHFFKSLSRPLLAGSLALLPSVAAAADFVQVDRLALPDSQVGDAAGFSVAVDGGTAVVCAERRTGFYYQTGACRVYESIGGTWTPTDLLVPSAPVYGGRFGDSVAIEGDVIVVGASAVCCLEATDAGRAFVFRRSGGTWSEEAMLAPADGVDDDFFGSAVALRGDTIAVGAEGHGGGALYVFRRVGTSWSLEQEFLPVSGFGGGFACSVAFRADDELFVGSYRGVSLLSRNGAAWQEAQFIDSSVSGFGMKVATDGVRLLIGSPQESATGAGSGALYVYEWKQPRWRLSKKLVALDAAGRLGGSVAIQDDTVVSGADLHDLGTAVDAGAVYVFRESQSGWTQSQKLEGSLTGAGDRFGRSVALDGAFLFAGAPEADRANPLNDGEAYIFSQGGINRQPVADAGSDATYECSGPGGALVTLDGSGSSDPDSSAGTNDDIVLFEWYEGTTLLGTGEVLQVLLPLGTHTIELRVTDHAGATSSDTTLASVVHTLPPTLTVTLSPATLWPPNHRLVDVTAAVALTGVCSPYTIALDSLTSSEPDDATGGADGNTVNDIQDAQIGADDRAFRLRAERVAQGSGRTYTTTYRVVQDGSTTASASATAFVPLNRDGVTDPISLTVTKTPAGARVDWSSVPGTPLYNVVRGRLQDIVDAGSAYSLGSVLCIEAASADTSNVGSEDAAIPAPGETFTYFVEYVDGGIGVSFGEESSAKPRSVASGGCP